MSNDEQKRLSEEMAARLWQRAAELQADAARRAETKSLLPAQSATSDDDTTGYALAHVRQAAEEAGIAGEFMDAALAEVAAGDSEGDHKDSVLDKMARRLLESPPESLEVRRLMAASAEDVYQTMKVVFPAAPYNLTLRDIQGDPLHGGVMVFEVPAMKALNYTRFEYDMSYPGIKQLMASIYRVDETSCEVVVRCPLRPGRRIVGGLFGTMTAGAAGVGALAGGVGLSLVVGAGLGVGTLGLVPLVAGFGLLGGASLGGASRAVSRKVYAFSMKRGVHAMEGLVGTLNVSVVSDWAPGGGGSSSVGDATAQRLVSKPTK